MAEKYTKLKTHRMVLRDAVPLDMPFTLFVDPSNYCNFKCSFCPRNQADFVKYAGSYKHMSIRLFSKIVDDLQAFSGRLKVLRLFYLGEPLLCPDFLAILKLACDKYIANRIEISTNASLLTEEYSRRILNIASCYAGDIYIRVSVYSIYQQKNEMITKNGIYVDKIRDNVATFYHMKNAMPEVRDRVKIYAKMLKSYSEEDVAFVKRYEYIVDEAELEEPMEWSSDQQRNLLGEVYSEKVVTSLRSKVMPKVCAYPFHTLAIQSDGKVVCCCVDWKRKTYVGDVNTESLYDIWHGKLMHDLRYAHLSGARHKIESCAKCLKLPAGGVYDADNMDNLSVAEYLRRYKSRYGAEWLGNEEKHRN